MIEEWNVPKAVISRLRDSLGQKVQEGATLPESARSALLTLFREYDSWASYTDDYEEKTNGYTLWLFGATIALSILAILAFHYPQTLLAGVLCAGAAGSCVSVMAKMPVLDVSLSGDLDAYGRRIWTRIGVGVVASLIGCGLLGWGLLPLAIQNETLADLVNACGALPTTACTDRKMLILLSVPMLFGFSERALTSFEQKIFGNGKGAETRGTGV